MLVPALVDAAASNPDWQVFTASAVATVTVGGGLSLAFRGAAINRFSLRHAFLLTSASWAALSAFAALPFTFLSADLHYADAFFEAISGLTTTGSTVLTGLDGLPPGMLIWRALLQWIGGVGIVLMAIIMLPFLRVGGMQLFQAESSDRSEKIVPRPAQLVSYIAGIYSLLTWICFLAYHWAGMGWFDALCHAMTTLSTGGYSTHDASMAYFDNGLILWCGTLFMAAGALPFVVYIKSMKGRPEAIWQDSQVRTLLGLLAVISLGLAFWHAGHNRIGFGEALTHAAFNVVSIVTTTGYASTDYTTWGPLAMVAFFMITFIGGSTGSTAGGIKIFRFQILWLITRAYLQRLISPSRAQVLLYEGRPVPGDVPFSVLAFITVFLGTVAVTTVVLSALGLDFDTSLSAAATSITNVGPGLGDIVGPAGNFATLPEAAKWVLSVAMLLGRLELFTVLVLFEPAFWRR
ncbi:MAG: TrkH family potassium uptake protein [Alphaproteobacteria bacterium]|nr:MAG: TrkH family potassium uptake protein [Alphaproteobacteria bacterium]